MYICNRCGCAAMAHFGKKLVCLNCGNEQAKVLSRKKQHSPQHFIPNQPSAPKPVSAAVSTPPPQAKKKQAPVFTHPKAKHKKTLAGALGIIVSIIIVVRVIIPLFGGLTMYIIDRVQYTTESSSAAAHIADVIENTDAEPNYQYVEDMPWFMVSEDGTVSFSQSTYLAEGNTEMHIVIPTELNHYPVSAIGYDGFLFCDELESVTIPDSVTVIETDAFWGCDNLKTIWLPDTITHIYYDAIYNCDTLEAVYYQGTPEQWDAIYIETPNEQLLDSLVIILE